MGMYYSKCSIRLKIRIDCTIQMVHCIILSIFVFV